jgi:hypothetical protein
MEFAEKADSSDTTNKAASNGPQAPETENDLKDENDEKPDNDESQNKISEIVGSLAEEPSTACK